MIIRQALDEHVTAINRVFEGGRGNTVGASEVAGCARRAFFEKVEGTEYGSPRNPDFKESWGARVRGSVMESAFWEPALRRRYGEHLVMAGEQQRTLLGSL